MNATLPTRCARSSAPPARAPLSSVSRKPIPAPAHARDFRPDGGDGGRGGEKRRACRVRHHRADRPQRGDRSQPHRHGLSGRPRAGALSAHPPERAVDLHRRHRLGIPVRARQRISGVRHGARQGGARHVQRGLHAGSGARARFARRGIDLHAGRQGQKPAVGDLADADLGARHREPGGRGDHAKSLRSRRARARHGGGARGDYVREHGRRHQRRRLKPRPGALSPLDARRGRLVGRLRRQAGPARAAMAAAGTL